VLAGVALAAVLVVATAIAAWPSGRSTHAGRSAADAATADTSTAAGASDPPSAGASAGLGTPSASPSRAGATTGAPPVRAGGKPGPGNTGVPAGTKLTVVNGNQEFSKDGQVVDGLDIHGFVQITGKNVTIRNSIVRGAPVPQKNASVLWVRRDTGASATIQDSEIAPAYTSPYLDGVWAINATMIRMNIHGAVDGVKAFDNVTLQDSWVHDLSWFASDPNQGGGETHNDTVQTYEGNRHIVLRHNTLYPGPKGNAAWQVTQDGGSVATDLHVENNWLDGGGCTLNFAHKGGPTPMTGIYVVGNRFGRLSQFQCPILVSTQTVLSQNSGNVWDDSGQTIPKPQQHD
jgi:hypothetical protein